MAYFNTIFIEFLISSQINRRNKILYIFFFFERIRQVFKRVWPVPKKKKNKNNGSAPPTETVRRFIFFFPKTLSKNTFYALFSRLKVLADILSRALVKTRFAPYVVRPIVPDWQPIYDSNRMRKSVYRHFD